MTQTDSEGSVSHCKACGYEAATGSEDWTAVESPSFGRLTSCPDCGSTDVTLSRR